MSTYNYNKKKNQKEERENKKLLIRIIIYGLGITGWVQLFILISGAFLSNGVIILNFNHFNEMVFEFILLLGILVSLCIFSLCDIKNIFKKVIYE
ncbi:MAG: hypothetical protein ACOC1X_03780 [Promethearchaeota archaeon]